MLQDAGHAVLYSIDATKLGMPGRNTAARIHKQKFDVVVRSHFLLVLYHSSEPRLQVFNFPHVGGRSTDVNRQVRANQALVVGLLQGAKRVLREGGKVLLTIFEGMPYELWGVR